MKRTIKKIFNKLGYDINKIPNIKDNLDIYIKFYGIESTKEKRFYNIGAGGFFHPAWTNIDFLSDWYKHNKKYSEHGKYVNYDLFSLKQIPLESNSAEVIYSSHTIEHINDEAAQNMFNESYRMLKKGGIFRVTTPNIDIEYRAYKDNDRYYFYWIDEYSIPKNYKRAMYNKPLNKASLEQIFLTHFASSVSTLHVDGAEKRIDDEEFKQVFSQMNYQDALNYCTFKCPLEIQKKYPGNHINWWNKDKLFKMLSKAGFDNIYLSGYGQSFSPALRETYYFDKTRPKNSIYIEASK